ncbi:MAG TPA: PilZ domain-containing protein [Terriglobales bacterium]|nr:PilZ domain-containing protein [Terriglobales bacterium]
MNAPAPKRSSRSMRRFPRYQLDVRIVVHVFRAGVNSTVWGRSTMIGQEGIGGTLTGGLELGEVVGLEFTLPLSRQPTKLRAIVRYKDGFQYGLEFLAMDAAQKEALRRACSILPLST